MAFASRKTELENTILYHNHEYKRTLDLRKDIYVFIHKNDVYPNSLIPEHKEALDVYMKESMESFPTNVELKPWQNELMKYIEPHDREIIWVVGKDGNEGKNSASDQKPSASESKSDSSD